MVHSGQLSWHCSFLWHHCQASYLCYDLVNPLIEDGEEYSRMHVVVGHAQRSINTARFSRLMTQFSGRCYQHPHAQIPIQSAADIKARTAQCVNQAAPSKTRGGDTVESMRLVQQTKFLVVHVPASYY